MRSRYHRYLYIIVVICALPLGVISAAPLLVNMSLIWWLRTTSCDSSDQKPPCILGPAPQAVRSILQTAHTLRPDLVGATENLAFAEFQRGNYETASDLLRVYWQKGQLRAAWWREDGARFLWFHSIISEQGGDIARSVDDMQRILNSVDFGFNKAQIEAASRRLAALLERQVSQPDASDGMRREAVVAAACAAQWQSMRSLLIDPAPTTWLTPDDLTLAYRLQAWGDEWAGEIEAANHARRMAGEVSWDQWSQGDELLWLGRRLETINGAACSAGTIALYDAYTAKHPESAQGDYLSGSHWIYRQEYLTAQEAFQRGLQREPHNAVIMRGLGRVSEITGAPAVAAEWYSRALEQAPQNAELHARLGRMYQSLDQPDAAQQQFDIALSLAPSEPLYWVWVGVFHETYGRLDMARQAFAKALQIAPDGVYAVNARNGLSRIERKLTK